MIKLDKGEKLIARGYGYKVYQYKGDYYIDTGRTMAWNYGPTLDAVAEFLYYQGYINEKNVDAIRGGCNNMTQREKATLNSWLQLCRDTERHYQFMFDNHLPGLFGHEITQADVNEMSAKRIMIETICDELKI